MWWIATAFAGTTTLWAAGDVVNLREGPDAAAEVVLRLPIGTRLASEEEQDGWTRVSLAGRPEAHRIEGWVRSDLATSTPPDAATLMATAATASPEEAEVLQSRARTLDPWHADVTGRFGQPETPVHLAICDGERIWVIGTLGSRGFAPIEGASESYAQSLATTAWYVEGWRAEAFPTPFLVPENAIGESGGDGWAAGAIDEDEQSFQIVLGACHPYSEGQVYATAPVPAVATHAAGPDRLRSALSTVSAPSLSGVIGMVPEASEGTELLSFVETTRRSCGGDDGTMIGTFWTWVAPDRTTTSFLANSDQSVRPGTGLAAWRRVGGRTVGVVLGDDNLTSVASVILLGADDTVSIEHVVLRYYGC